MYNYIYKMPHIHSFKNDFVGSLTILQVGVNFVSIYMYFYFT